MNDFSGSKKNLAASVIINGVVFLSTLITAVIGVTWGAGDGQLGNFIIGWGYFKPFTIDSNILAGASSLIMMIFGIRSLKAGKVITPRWAMTLHLTGTASVGLTFVVVLFFLAPMQAAEGKSFWNMYTEDMFFFHLVNPILCLISFVFLQKKYICKKSECLIGAVPTFLYTLLYLTMVVFLKRWDDFYGFTFGGNYALIPVVIIVVDGAAIALARGMIAWHNRKAADTTPQ